MQPLELIIEEHAQLLKSRGYDTGGLKNGFLKEDLLSDLKQRLSQAVLATETEGRAEIFALTTKGLFNDNSDIVTFHLFYKADSDKSGVDLYKLEVSHEQFVKKFNLNTSYHLPPATEAFEILKRERELLYKRNQQLFGKDKQSVTRRKKRGKRP